MPNEVYLVDTSVWIFALRKQPVVHLMEKPLSFRSESYVRVLKKGLYVDPESPDAFPS